MFHKVNGVYTNAPAQSPGALRAQYLIFAGVVVAVTAAIIGGIRYEARKRILRPETWVVSPVTGKRLHVPAEQASPPDHYESVYRPDNPKTVF